MYKIRFTLLIIVCFSLSSLAQDKSRSLLDDVSTKLLSYNSLQADFSFSLVNEEADIYDTYKGSLVMQAEKFRLKMMGVIAMCNGDKMWNYSEDMNEATIVDPDESEFFNPVNIFTLYKENFKLKTISSKGSIHTIELMPTDDTEEYTRILITIDHAKSLINEVTYFGADDNKYIIKITNVIPNIQVDDRFFTFDATKYPGVSVYDMR